MINSQSVVIPLGQGGLRTDDSQDFIPITNVISARNVDFSKGLIQKEPGSMRWNQSALPAAVAG